MTDQPQHKPQRATISGELARAWEMLGLALTRTPNRGSEQVEFNKQGTGDLKGQILPKWNFVRGEDEDWDDYRARYQRQSADILQDAAEMSAGQIERDLAATLEKAKGEKS